MFYSTFYPNNYITSLNVTTNLIYYYYFTELLKIYYYICYHKSKPLFNNLYHVHIDKCKPILSGYQKMHQNLLWWPWIGCVTNSVDGQLEISSLNWKEVECFWVELVQIKNQNLEGVQKNANTFSCELNMCDCQRKALKGL